MDAFDEWPDDASLPVRLGAKNEKRFSLELLSDELSDLRCVGLIDMYLSWIPRYSFCRLPPIRNRECARWATTLILEETNLIAAEDPADSEDEELVVGHAALVRDDRNPLWCELLLAVVRDFRGVGLGSALACRAVQLARQRGFREVWLDVEATNVRARRIYARCGFRKVSHPFDREIRMVLDLKQPAPAELVGV